MTEIEKWRIYIRYLVSHFSLKHAYIVDIQRSNTTFKSKNNHYIEVNECKAVCKTYDLARSECVSFLDFISGRKIVTDNGDDWQEQGFAQRIRTDSPNDTLEYWKIRMT